MANKRTPEEGRMILAANIKRFSEDPSHCTFTSEEIADRLGISERQWQRYKKGDSEPPATALFDIAKVLKVDMYALVLSKEERLDAIKAVLNQMYGGNVNDF